MPRVSLGSLKRYESLVWIAVLAGVLWLRWPLLKGYYYRTARVEAPATTIAWRTDLQAALSEARETGRPVLASFGATWCPWCTFMKHDVWTDPAVQRAVEAGFIPLDVDVDREPATSSRFGVDAVPTMIVIDGSGAEMRRSGFLDAGNLLAFLSGN